MKVRTVDHNDFSVRSSTRPSVRQANNEPSWSGLQEVMDLLLFKGQARAAYWINANCFSAVVSKPGSPCLEWDRHLTDCMWFNSAP